jgi:hypothetical protein
MKKIKEIESIGGIEADNDNLLMTCFQDHDAFKQLRDFKKQIILGRKGTGKTAIFKKLLNEEDSRTFTYGHTFSEYPWHHHDKQVKLGVPEHEKYMQSWKYLILLTISKILLNHDDNFPFDEDSLDRMSKLESFVKDSYGTTNPDITDIFSPSKQLKIKPNFSLDIGVLKSGISPENVPVEHLPTIIQEVNRNLADYVIKSLNPDNRYYILFDQLDLGFDPNDPNYNNRIIGLLLASRDLNNHARELEKKLSVTTFLRDDIYDKLKFDDKNKLTHGYTTFIEWDVRGQHTLKQLIERRFNEVLKSDERENISWEDVFDENQSMTGRQTKYNYITERTFLRPRDIIRFTNEIIYQHKNNNNEEEKIKNKDVNSAKNEYSRYFLEELDDEIHKHLPEYEGILDVIRKIGYYQFKFHQFQQLLDQRQNLFREQISAHNALKKLFEFSIVGFYQVGGMGYGGSGYVFKYKDNKIQFDENAKIYRIHLGLVETLGLKLSTKPDE